MLHAMHKLFNLNAASVSTNLGCGMIRHLCLTLYPTFYATLLTTQVVPPPNPRATPAIPEGAAVPKSASICYAHDTATQAFNTFHNIECSLRQKLLDAVEDTFVRVKHKPYQWYSGYITLDLLTHLYETYALISSADWLANNKRFHEEYTPTVPI